MFLIFGFIQNPTKTIEIAVIYYLSSLDNKGLFYFKGKMAENTHKKLLDFGGKHPCHLHIYILHLPPVNNHNKYL